MKKKSASSTSSHSGQSLLVSPQAKGLANCLFLQSVDPVLVVDTGTGILVEANPAAENFLGYPRTELAGMPLSQLDSLDDLSRILAKCRHGTQESPSDPIEIAVLTASGEQQTALVKAAPFEADGKMLAVLIVRDVTEHKKTESLLARRKTFEELAGKLTSDFLRMRPEDLDKGVTAALAAIGEFSNVSRASVFLIQGNTSLSDNTHEWCAPGIESKQDNMQGIDLSRGAPLLWETLSKGESVHLPDISSLPKGSADKLTLESHNMRSLLMEPIFIQDRFVGFLGFTGESPHRYWTEEDREVLRLFCKSMALVLERKLSEKALVQSREEIWEQQAKLALAMDMSKMALWEGDVFGAEFTFNDQFFSLYGTTVEREGGYTIPAAEYVQEFFHPDDMWMMDREIERIIDTDDVDAPQMVEHRIIRRDGEERHMAVRYKQLRDRLGKTIKTIGVNQDITDRKRTEQKLIEAKLAAETANQAKSEFLANMSHEIRTPLNGIIGMLQLIQLKTPDNTSSEYATTALSSCKRLARLLGDILDLSRIEANRMSLAQEPFALQGVMESVETLFRSSVNQAGLTLRTFVDQDIPALLGDEYRLQQVLNNLVGNAVKFTKTGSITIEAYSLASNNPDVCRVYFRVVDTGMGIADDTLDVLFQPFTQAETSDAQKAGGTGLGLSITKKLLDLMGGTISVTSEVGVGTTFRFSLSFEISQEAADVQPEKYALKETMSLGLNVLVVEDDLVSRLAITVVLKDFDCAVTTVENGEDALKALAQDTYDVVVMDRRLPILGGVETTRAIRRGDAGEANKLVPIIALTASAMADEEDSFLEAGADDYMAKPVDFRLLFNALQRFVAES